MKVFVVLKDYGYEGERLAGVYSDRGKAELVKSGGDLGTDYNIYEVDIDEPANSLRDPIS